MVFVLIAVIVAFVVVTQLSHNDEQEDETAKYQVTDMTADNVTKLSYTNENGTFNFTKVDDSWQYDNDTSLNIKESTINNMVIKVASLESDNQITDVSDASIYGLDTPDITISISDGSKTETIKIGDYNLTTSTYYVSRDDDTSVIYTTTSATISSFQTQSIDEFVEVESETQNDEESESEIADDSQTTHESTADSQDSAGTEEAGNDINE